MPAFFGSRKYLRRATLPRFTLDFLTGVLDSQTTLTRASTGWAFNSAGSLASAATNVARFDYNKDTLVAQGLLLEVARTNSLTNNSNTGAAAGTPGTLPTSWVAAATAGGITRTIVGFGTVNGLPYIDLKFTGTAVAADTVTFLNATTGAATVNATTWTSSAYISLVAGSLTNVTVKHGLRYRAAAGANITAQIYETSIVPTATLTRYSRSNIGSDATIAFVLGSLNLTMAAGAVDVTLRIAAPQLELGAAASSPILCTSAAVTRAVDAATTTVTNATYDILVQDRNGAEWRDGVVVAAGSYTLTTRSGQNYLTRVLLYQAGALNATQKTALQVAW